MLKYFTSAAFFESIIVILFGVIIIGITNALDKRYLKSKAGNGKWYRSAKMMFDFINTVIILILVLLVLSINGVNVAKYVTSLGVVGIIASFALQDLLKDVVMGLSIMFEGYFKVGDVVEYNGEEAKVVSFNIKTTKLFMIGTETTMSICNRNITQIGTASDWVDILIPISYEVDLYVARGLCREAAKRIERLRNVYSCDFLNTQELADSCINYKLRIHCLPDKKPSVRRNANAVIQDVFYERGQSFPYNVLVIQNMEPTEKKKIEALKVSTVQDGKDVVVYNSSSHKKRVDYELGRGAAKSKTITFDGSEKAVNAAIQEAERYSGSENLGKAMKLRIRLLSEELISMMRGLPNMKNGQFHIRRDGSDYEICFEADAKINKETRNSLVGVSSSNLNEAYTGIGGMVTQAIDSMMLMSINDKNGVSKASMNAMEESIGKADDDYKWSYNIYKEKEMQSQLEDDNSVNPEELGKSVLTKMSDDIRISVRTKHVSIRVLVKNDEDE